MFSVHVKELDDLKTQYTDFLKKLRETEDAIKHGSVEWIDEETFWEND
jgi:hypothetical protein